MRRAPLVISGTAVGLAGVLSFHARTPKAVAPPSVVASAAAPSTASSGSSAKSSSTKVVTGKVIPTPYGNAQVRVTVTNGKITKIEALQLQGNDPKSVQISSSAEPTLRDEALQAQSAAIDAVSGATFTSTSYEASLQSALDTAGFKAANGSRGSTTVPNITPEHHGGGDGDRGGFGGPPPNGGVPPQDGQAPAS